MIPVHYPAGDPAPAQLAANLMECSRDIQIAALEAGETWTAPPSTAH